MASRYKFRTRDEKIELMRENNPNREIELCTAVVDGTWAKAREGILMRIPERFSDAKLSDLGVLEQPILDASVDMFSPPDKDGESKVGIVFTGVAGTGKTHAAYALIKKITEKNPDMVAFMVNYVEALSRIKTEFIEDEYDDLGSTWDRLTNDSGSYPGMIFIDDFSSKKLTEFESEKMLLMLEKRFNSYMPFLITTNVAPNDFYEVFGERIASRLLGYCHIIDFEAWDISDKRLEIKK